MHLCMHIRKPVCVCNHECYCKCVCRRVGGLGHLCVTLSRNKLATGY